MTNIRLIFSIFLVIVASFLFIGSINNSMLKKVNIFEIGGDMLKGEIKEYSFEEVQTLSCTLEKPTDRTIILRIDDITYWNDLDLMKKITDEILSRNYGVSLGVIPKGIENDESLIKWLQKANENPYIELSMHGYEHTENEFGILNYGEAKEKIILGRDIMIRYFGEIPINFIPPYNIESQATLNALKDLGFKTYSGDRNEYNVDNDFAIAGFSTTTLVYSQDKFINSEQVLNECKAGLDKNSVCVIMMHPQDFIVEDRLSERRYSEFIKILDGLEGLDAQVVNFRRAFCKEY